jgi:subtilisin family serine protease
MKIPFYCAFILKITLLCCLSGGILADEKLSPINKQALVSRINESGNVRIIVQLKHVAVNNGVSLSPMIDKKHYLKSAIQNVQDQIKTKLLSSNAQLQHEFNYIPFMVYKIDEKALLQLENIDEVVNIQIDNLSKPLLSESIPIIGADNGWTLGYSGEGKTIAIIDTGVDKTHEFLSNKVVSEACYSTSSDMTNSLCPSGNDIEEVSGAGVHCNLNGCFHGTHVAGIAAGNGTNFSGVAKSADIIAIQVFTAVNSADFCGNNNPCLGAYDSDIIKGLERVFELLNSYDIPAINLSLGGQGYSSQSECNAQNNGFLFAVSNLTDAGVAVVAASGNNGFSDRISAPACVTGAISVGASSNNDNVANFTNQAPFLSYLAPGVSIQSSVPNNGYSQLSGTSMATPHVAGAIAVLASHDSSPNLQNILTVLTDSAQGVFANSTSYARIQLDDALEILSGDNNDIVTTTMDLTLSGDNGEEVYINGNYVGSSSNWTSATSYIAELNVGNNIIAVKGMDDGGAAALIVEIQVNGETRYSDSNWKISNVYQQGWENTDFDDSSWTNATEYGSYGVSPWRKRVSGLDNASQANWIWSDNNVDDDIVYFRHSVLVDDNGQVDPVNIDTLTLADGEVNADYNATLIGSGGFGSYLWSVTAGVLPNGLLLSSETGDITGIPTTQDNYDFTITLEDAVGDSVRTDFNINIAAQVVNPEPVNINTLALDDGEVNQDYSKILIGSGGEEPYMWFVTNGTLPDGLLLDSETGTISGVPTTQGINAFMITLQGFNGDSTSADFNINIAEQVEEPAPISIDSLELGDGEVNQTYNETLIASGGEQPYLWSISNGTLPNGLLLNNETGGISGTPTTQGINNFTVTLEDSDGDSTGSDLSITIVAQQDEDVVLNLIISGDNGEEVYINGSYVGGSNNWFTASNYSAVLNEGNNIIAVKGMDDGGAAALIAEIQVHGETRYSDSNWKISNVYQQGWEDADFDDSSWTNATEYGSYGVSPWRKRVSGLDNASQANWIWSDNNDDDNVIYFRYTISNN